MSGDLSPKALVEVRDALEAFHRESSSFTNRHGPHAASKSPFADDVIAFPRSESVHTVYGQSVTLIEITADHLTAFRKLISEPLETIAPWTCARIVLDAASLAAWIVQPGIDAKERVGRSLALRYEGLSEQVKWARAVGPKNPDVDPQVAVDRIAEVTADASRLGFDPVRDRNGRQIGIGRRMPSVTERVRDVLDQEDMYRLLSAITHGHFWATNQAGFEVLGPIGTTADGARLRAMTKAVNPSGMLYLAAGIALAFGRATWSHCLYAGWNRKELAEMLAELFRRLEIRDRYWFWHKGS